MASYVSIALIAGILAGEPNDGIIRGTIAPPERITSIQAVPRHLNLTCPSCKKQVVARGNVPGKVIVCKGCGKKTPVPVVEAKIDHKLGVFEIPGLARDQRYDLIVTTKVGRIEGIDLSPHESELERLRRRRVRANPKEFTDDDRDAVTELITKVKQFENFVRPLYIRGHGDKATALVEKARIQDETTGKFHSEKGNEAIWRVELWYFRRWFGGWERVSNVEAVLYRKRMSRADYDRMAWVFSDKLGGIEVGPAGTAKSVAIVVPEQLDPDKGRTPRRK